MATQRCPLVTSLWRSSVSAAASFAFGLSAVSPLSLPASLFLSSLAASLLVGFLLRQNVSLALALLTLLHSAHHAAAHHAAAHPPRSTATTPPSNLLVLGLVLPVVGYAIPLAIQLKDIEASTAGIGVKIGCRDQDRRIANQACPRLERHPLAGRPCSRSAPAPS